MLTSLLAAFLRFVELAKLVRSDVKIENDMLRLFIQSSKPDQCRDGSWIVVVSSRKATCPVAMMKPLFRQSWAFLR